MSRMDDIATGVKGGLFGGAVFSTIALVLWLVQGAEAFAEARMTLGALVAAYMVGGLAVGGVVGLLLPFARTPVGAALVGSLAGVSLVVVMGLLMAEAADDMEHFWTAATITGVGLGAPSGVLYHRIFLDR